MKNYMYWKPFQSRPQGINNNCMGFLFVLFFLLGFNYCFEGTGTNGLSKYAKFSEQHGGDCAATGVRRPVWDDRVEMVSALPKFRVVYGERPFKRNSGGMRFDHSFALWYMLTTIEPKPAVVVESGAHKGHSTWLIRQALPSAKIISISPEAPEIDIDNVIYRVDKNFTDFAEIEWDSFGFKPEEALVFFDDHQSAFRRIFRKDITSDSEDSFRKITLHI